MAWRFILDGQDVTTVALDKQATRTLNGVGTARCRIPSKLTTVAKGTSRLKVYDSSNVLWHHGIVWFLQDDGDENTCYTTVQTVDPMALWAMRPARDLDGDYSYPSFLTTQSSGPQIMRYILQNSILWEGSLLLDMGGTVETGGVNLAGTPVDYPMTVADVFNALAETGQLDVVIDPVDVGGAIGRFNAYNGNYGTDLSGSVVFRYGTGGNVRRIVRTQDMSTMRNKTFYYLGPKKQTITDPDATQHWRTNVTGDHPSLPNPPGGDVDYPNPLGNLINASRSNYWTAMEIRTFDSALDSGTDSVTAQLGTDALYLRLWQAEQLARVNGKTVAKVTPVRGTEPAFTAGDLVSVQAGPVVRGGFSEVQRVYKIIVNIDNNGVVDLGEIETSADQEAI